MDSWTGKSFGSTGVDGNIWFANGSQLVSSQNLKVSNVPAVGYSSRKNLIHMIRLNIR